MSKKGCISRCKKKILKKVIKSVDSNVDTGIIYQVFKREKHETPSENKLTNKDTSLKYIRILNLPTVL